MNARRAGFTLLELVIVLSILSLVALLAAHSLHSAQDQHRYAAANRQLDALRAAIWPQADPVAPSGPVATVTIKPWTPDVPYLTSLRRARTPATRLKAYLKARADWSASPAFYLDCADHLYSVGDAPLARRVLSNLAELRIDDPALLRVFAWRLRQAGELDLAVVQLRRVARLRPEDPQSFRDLALVLAERGQANRTRADIEEAFALFRKVALTPWQRHPTVIAVFALEEHNALAAWVDAQEWPDGTKPAPPAPLPEPF